MENKGIALYHRVMPRENFEKAAKDLFHLIQSAQIKFPNSSRLLYVDIDGHRNEAGGFDEDMLELQKEYGAGFLLKFCDEIHLPLISVKNKKGQCNDVPDKLDIFNANNNVDDTLHSLYMENYSNTEFQAEPQVFSFLKDVCEFLKEFNEAVYGVTFFSNEKIEDEPLLTTWQNHIMDLISELFNSFVQGNLLSASAMTRALIECYVYYSILLNEKNETLISEWFLCSLVNTAKRLDASRRHKVKKMVFDFCNECNLNGEEKWKQYIDKKANANSWLKPIIPEENISFRKACEYLGDSNIYKDFQETSAFVHGQDFVTKMNPFVFYESIYHRMYMMMSYIFKMIEKLGADEAQQEQIEILKIKLALLYNFWDKK